MTADQLSQALASLARPTHQHCMHPHEGVIHMVVPNGHALMRCCECSYTETRHRSHAHAVSREVLNG